MTMHGLFIVGGRWAVNEWLRGGPERGVYRARTAESVANLVTMSLPIGVGYAELGTRLETDSPWVAPLHWMGRVDAADGAHYSAMVEAEPRGLALSESAFPLPSLDVLALARGLAALIADTSSRGFTARGIRPETVYMETGEKPEVTQVVPRGETFLAAAGPSSQGVPPCYQNMYAAPEVFRGAASPASDVFSIAAVLAHATTGAHPFGDDGPLMQLAAMSTGHRSAIRWPAELAATTQLLDAALSPKPGDRPTPAALLAALAQRARR